MTETEDRDAEIVRMDGEHIVEVWRKVPGYACEVSSEGRVMGLTRLLSPWLVSGYPRVQVRPDDGPPPDRKAWPHIHVHVLVALAFIGPKPSSAHEVAHGDGTPIHNRPHNLSWATRLKNAADRDRHGRTARHGSHGCAKLTAGDVADIRRRCVRYCKQNGQLALAREYGVTQTQIWRIVNGANWQGADHA